MKHLRIYDNGGKTFDRYTIVDMTPETRFSNGAYPMVGASLTGLGFYQHGEIEPQHLGRHLGKRVAFETLHPDLQSRLKHDYDHIENLYNETVQLRVPVTFADGEKDEFTVITYGRDKIPDCQISSITLNLWFRTPKGVNAERYISLSSLKNAVRNMIHKRVRREVVEMDFYLTDTVNLF
jgi:hypothetical protein